MSERKEKLDDMLDISLQSGRKRFSPWKVDCANGVAGIKLIAFRDHLQDAFRFELFNAGSGKLNYRVSAYFIVDPGGFTGMALYELLSSSYLLFSVVPILSKPISFLQTMFQSKLVIVELPLMEMPIGSSFFRCCPMASSLSWMVTE